MRSTLLVALLLPACASASATATPAEASAAPLPDRDPALAKRLVEEEGGILLDVRTAEEFAEGHLDGAVNVSHDEIESRLAEIEALTGGDTSTPIVTYCRSGNRAGQARATLEAAGYTRVTNVGGLADYPTE
ncbi:MAG: rhodanese-like domain-containing protein [Myxococcota bacterium]